jgi:hypothetical protein
LATESGNQSLLTRFPVADVADLLSELTPPREFLNASFSNYFEDSNFPTQGAAKAKLEAFARSGKSGKLPGIYLDGGFGVGKTHLLASIWHEFKGKKAFGSFIAYTSLIGALGFAEAVQALSKFELSQQSLFIVTFVEVISKTGHLNCFHALLLTISISCLFLLDINKIKIELIKKNIIKKFFITLPHQKYKRHS